MVRLIACWTAAALLGVTGLAQETKPTFETASVRPQRELTAAIEEPLNAAAVTIHHAPTARNA